MSTLPHQFRRLVCLLEGISEYTGRAVAWLVLAMTLLVGVDVALRYLFQTSSVAMQELEWHLFGLIFLLGAAYTLKADGHVRVEVLYQKFSARGRAWADLVGDVIFLVPFCLLILYASAPFVWSAFQYGEHSPDPGGLPYRWALKAAIPAGFLLLLIQGAASIANNALFLLGRRTEQR